MIPVASNASYVRGRTIELFWKIHCNCRPGEVLENLQEIWLLWPEKRMQTSSLKSENTIGPNPHLAAMTPGSP
jgi:hypothetical protein